VPRPPRIELALPVLYVEAIERVGGVPLVVPPLGLDLVPTLLERVDGVCLPGGSDMEPSNYGAEPHPQLGQTQPWADALQMALVREADRRGLPLLAICRGMQVLNVARGGTLHQHLPDVVGEQVMHRQEQPGKVRTHGVTVAPRSRVRELLGSGPPRVNSFHHQGIKDLGRGLVATAWARDGTIEAVEEPGERLVLGVQWHAEHLPGDGPLFEALVAAAAGEPRLAQVG
jgi:putative glutamine amidotransferase